MTLVPVRVVFMCLLLLGVTLQAPACGGRGGGSDQAGSGTGDDSSSAGSDDAAGGGGSSATGGIGEDGSYVTEGAYTDFVTVDDQAVIGPAGREIPLRIRYAASAPTPLPIVIWSHAGSWRTADGGRNSHAPWSKRLAAAGYAVIHMSHVEPTLDQLNELCIDFGLTDPADCDDSSVDGEPGQAEAEAEAGHEEAEFVPGTFKPFQSVGVCRPGDTIAVLDALAADELVAGVELDASRIAVAGWSGGSTTPMQLAGGSRVIAVGMEPYQLPPRDDVDAYVALSAQGAGFSNWYDDEYNVTPAIAGTSWDEVAGPFLSLTGVFDRANGMEAVDRLKPYENMPAGDKWLLYSDDDRGPLNHNTFDLKHADSPEAHAQALTTAITSSVIAFLDWHLRARPEAQAWLESDSASTLLGVGGRWETK